MSNRAFIFGFITVFTLIIISWFLVHLLAVFGIFLALAYPIWWLFAPQQSVCLLCRAGRDNSNCPFCRQPIKKNDSVSPVNFSSAVKNGLLILLLSFISVGVVLGESRILSKLGFPRTPKTVSFVVPAKKQYRLGEIFPMKVEISGIKVPINAVQADISFDTEKLEVVNISTEDSFANIFVQKEINNDGGYARLVGGLPNPGFFSDHGTFGTIFLKGKTPGVARVDYLPSSMVLANDGRGTNVIKGLTSISYLILPERISEEEEKQQEIIASKSSVLGATTDTTQMTFYEENNVLGAKSPPAVVEQKFSDKLSMLFQNFWDTLSSIDKFILDQWSKFFHAPS